MNRILPLLTAGALAAGFLQTLAAAIPPAEKLLSSDTLAVLSVPDWSKVEAARKDAPMYLLWNDPALRPFREKLVAKLTNDVIGPLERELGLHLADYADLLQGQLTVAVAQNGWTGGENPLPALVLVLDTRDKADLLTKNLADVRKKLTETGRTVRTEKIRDVEFSVLTLDTENLMKTVASITGPDAKPAPPAPGKSDATPRPEIAFGQSGPVLLAGTSTKELEKILARLSGAGSASLAELPAFESDQKALLQDALSFGWIHFSPINTILTEVVGKIETDPAQPAPVKPDQALAALGLSGLKTLAFRNRQNAEGTTADLFLGVPEDQRNGLFRLLATEAKDAAPPPFVPADAVQFNRWRLDGQKFWASLNAMLNQIAPGMPGFMIAQLEGILKQKDPAFDFNKNFVANLGDDLIMYEKAPRGNSFEEIASPPAITLIGSPNPDQLFQALKAATLLLPPPFGGAQFKEREFQGRKIYSLPLPTLPTEGQSGENSLSFATAGGYLALTSDSGILEEYLRSGDAKPKPLTQTPGLNDAAQKVGGTATGLFGCQNDAENMRSLFNLLQKNPDLISQLFALTPIAPQAGDADKVLKEWLDFSLLPPFDKIAKYFHLSVFAGQMTPRGYALRIHTPQPPQLKR
ncbi:MAG TPA: hypothetical protein PKM73_05960 [Verrucomicrobiota bacterium]|nr:hypothetical protein [Verrucomicrobiota bacterium]HNU50468.1 hypothetical protein [Verrucomicrobiota bacterium]